MGKAALQLAQRLALASFVPLSATVVAGTLLEECNPDASNNRATYDCGGGAQNVANATRRCDEAGPDRAVHHLLEPNARRPLARRETGRGAALTSDDRARLAAHREHRILVAFQHQCRPVVDGNANLARVPQQHRIKVHRPQHACPRDQLESEQDQEPDFLCRP